jgi:hypothetical protein
MPYRISVAVIAFAMLPMTVATAPAQDQSKYPDLRGEWRRVAVPSGTYRGVQYDPHKPAGPGQQAPLTGEYQAIFEANLADQALGGQAGDPTYRCLSPGMPRVMAPYGEMEIVVVPETTYILIDHIHDSRRIYTDGRDFPPNMADNPQFTGYSIGRWVDEDGRGRYNALIVETRGMKGPRTFEMTGIPLHEDNQTIVKERIYLDRNDLNTLHNEITTIDHALTRPWTVVKDYRRTQTKDPIWWNETVCAENNVHVMIGNEIYYLSADRQLMPSKKDQPPPDLKYFRQGRK